MFFAGKEDEIEFSDEKLPNYFDALKEEDCRDFLVDRILYEQYHFTLLTNEQKEKVYKRFIRIETKNELESKLHFAFESKYTTAQDKGEHESHERKKKEAP